VVAVEVVAAVSYLEIKNKEEAASAADKKKEKENESL